MIISHDTDCAILAGLLMQPMCSHLTSSLPARPHIVLFLDIYL